MSDYIQTYEEIAASVEKMQKLDKSPVNNFPSIIIKTRSADLCCLRIFCFSKCCLSGICDLSCELFGNCSRAAEYIDRIFLFALEILFLLVIELTICKEQR